MALGNFMMGSLKVLIIIIIIIITIIENHLNEILASLMSEMEFERNNM